jgi:streptogramin lyase
MKPTLRSLRIFPHRNLLPAAFLLFLGGCAASNNANVVTVAGNGRAGTAGDGGPAIDAQFNTLWGAAVDSSGNFYISDGGGEVRKVTVSTGVISTVAGTGTSGYSGDSGPATKAELNGPFGIAIDTANNLYIADRGNNVIRKVDAATGIISTVAGSGLAGFTGDGGIATKAKLNMPENIAIDRAGDLYITDFLNGRVREVSASTGTIQTVAGGGSSTAENVPATTATLGQPDCVAVDGNGNLYLCDRNREGIRKIDAATGMVNTIAGNGNYGETGDGGPATSAELSTPFGIAFTATGEILVVDYASGSVREINTATGHISTIAKFPAIESPTAVAANGSGQFYVTDSQMRVVHEIAAVQ